MYLENPEVYTTSFEKLVGVKGGGNRDIQISELKQIAEFINFDISQSSIEEISDNLFGHEGLYTFRTGQIGSWKLYFSEEHISSFKQYFGKELIQLGYEKDFNW
jgi:hypothetical protein